MDTYKKFDIDSIVFIGRTFDEYTRMFSLDVEGLKGEKVLDCPAGACSFISELNKKGFTGIASDILYGLEPEVLEKKCKEDLEKVVNALSRVEGLYKWDFYKNVKGLRKKRTEAYRLFIEDYTEGINCGRYVKSDLPFLPFADKEFSLVLSAHFLFLYHDRLHYEFHIKSLRELIRVTSREVRIFPLLGLDAKKCPFLNKAIEDIQQDNLSIEIVKVPFEFQKGGNEMLRILKKCH